MARILLYHLFSNGDCLYATVVARQIKHDHPGCHLTWAIAANCRSMIDNNPYVDEIIEITMNPNQDKEAEYYRHLDFFKIQKQDGVYDEIITTQIIGNAFSNYDGCVSTSIYRCYGRPITVGYKPTLVLTDDEKQRAQEFVKQNNLQAYKQVILFECAPMSGQIKFTLDFIENFTKIITKSGDVAVVLSAAKKIPLEIDGVFDGSQLTIRETVALSNYCSLLLGCSSGITWATTSIEDRQIPMVQILDKEAYIFNPPSIVFEKTNQSLNGIIEMYQLDMDQLVDCIQKIFKQDFLSVQKIYHQNAPQNFKIFRGIVHTLILNKKFGSLVSFIKMNIKEHGYKRKMLLAISKGILLFPIQYWLNKKK